MQDKAVQLSIFKCAWCGQPLPKGRADMRTHKECRPKLFRWRRKMLKRVEAAKATMIDVGIFATYDFSREEGIEILKALSAALESAYAQANVRRIK